jgi:hypothetical protein
MEFLRSFQWEVRFFLFLLLSAGLGNALLVSPAFSSDITMQEYEIKAAYLYNFSKFVEWPPQALPPSQNKLTFCILGDSPFESFSNTLRDRKVGGRIIVVKHAEKVEVAAECNVLFVSASEQAEVYHHLSALQGRAILTVGETRGFARSGGIIEFFLQEKRVRFRINIDAAARVGLTLSSHLLELADIIREHPPGESR